MVEKKKRGRKPKTKVKKVPKKRGRKPKNIDPSKITIEEVKGVQENLIIQLKKSFVDNYDIQSYDETNSKNETFENWEFESNECEDSNSMMRRMDPSRYDSRKTIFWCALIRKVLIISNAATSAKFQKCKFRTSRI